jgi:hypothetical protein
VSKYARVASRFRKWAREPGVDGDAQTVPQLPLLCRFVPRANGDNYGRRARKVRCTREQFTHFAPMWVNSHGHSCSTPDRYGDPLYSSRRLEKPPLNETLKAQRCIMVLCRPPYAGFCRRLPIKSRLLFRSLRQFPFSDTSLRRGQQLRRLDSPTHNFGRIRRIGL